ncbi:cytosolic enolase 3 [Tanacetum coccineum]
MDLDTMPRVLDLWLELKVAGGDGTVGWILGVISDLNLAQPPPVATVLLGTRNNLSRAFGWILESRGIPTVEVDLFTNKGLFRASSPSASSSSPCRLLYEAGELRDSDKAVYLRNGVTRAVRNINEKLPQAIVGMDPTLHNQIDQAIIDLDKTQHKKGELGGNAILAVSIGACKIGAAEKEACTFILFHIYHVLSIPTYTLIIDGKHAGNNLAIRLEQRDLKRQCKWALRRIISSLKVMAFGSMQSCEAMIGWVMMKLTSATITEKYSARGCNVGEDGGLAPNISRHVVR